MFLLVVYVEENSFTYGNVQKFLNALELNF